MVEETQAKSSQKATDKMNGVPADAAEAVNDFNLIAANCNTNVCFFCQKSFTNV